MRRVRLFCIFILLALSSQLFGGDRAEIWSRMYKRSVSQESKLSIMLNIVELNDRGMIPLLEEILSEDIIANLNNKRGVTEQQKFLELTKLVIKELGELKSKSSAPLVYTIVNEIDDPLVKAEGVMALGNMRADKYVDDVAFTLRNLSMRPVQGAPSDIEAEGKVAFGCVAALDRFKSIDGYSPVFFASTGWYNKRIKGFADKVLKTIVDNPIEALIPILVDGELNDKAKAIKEVAVCNAPSEDKAKAALVALKQGHDNVPGSIQEGMVLTIIRKDSIKILYSSKSANVDDVYPLSQSLKNGSDLEEKIYAIRTLGQNGTDEAIAALSSVLGEFNQRNIDGIGISYSDEDVVREIIVTLGNSGNASAKGILTEVQFSGYPNGLVRVAKEALKKLK